MFGLWLRYGILHKREATTLVVEMFKKSNTRVVLVRMVSQQGMWLRIWIGSAQNSRKVNNDKRLDSSHVTQIHPPSYSDIIPIPS